MGGDSGRHYVSVCRSVQKKTAEAQSGELHCVGSDVSVVCSSSAACGVQLCKRAARAHQSLPEQTRADQSLCTRARSAPSRCSQPPFRFAGMHCAAMQLCRRRDQAAKLPQLQARHLRCCVHAQSALRVNRMFVDVSLLRSACQRDLPVRAGLCDASMAHLLDVAPSRDRRTNETVVVGAAASRGRQRSDANWPTKGRLKRGRATHFCHQQPGVVLVGRTADERDRAIRARSI